MKKTLAVFAAASLILATFSNAGNAATPVTATSKANPIPVSLPVAQNGPITFANITEHISEISATAYAAVQKVEAENSQPKIPTRIYVGPHTITNVPDVPAAFKKIMKFWSGFRQPTSYHALIFNYQDRQWAIKKAATISVVKKTAGVRGGTGILDRIKQCSAPRRCSGANSGLVDGFSAALGQFGMDPVHNAQDAYFQTAGIQGHEYTHAVQGAQFLGNRTGNSANGAFQNATPCWFSEGQANFAGTAAEAATFEDYMKWRSGMPKGWPIPEFTDYSAASLLRVLKTSKPPACLPPNPIYSLGYGIGGLVLEALTAIGGGESSMAILAVMSRGKTFEQAFLKVYGITWNEAAPILAQVAATEYAATR